MTTPPPAALLTVNATAARLGLHPFTIRRRIADGTIRAVRIGRRTLRVPASEVDRLSTPVAVPSR